MERKLPAENEEDFFFVHDAIVYGAVKRCGISFTHPDYDDFIQIGLLKLVEAYEEFPNSLRNELSFYQFTGYAYRKVRWAVIDEMRKGKKIQERTLALPDHSEEFSVLISSNETEDVQFSSLISVMQECLSKKERVYFDEAVLNQRTVTEIAKKHQVSRKTVYAWKKQIAKKLQHFKQDVLN